MLSVDGRWAALIVDIHDYDYPTAGHFRAVPLHAEILVTATMSVYRAIILKKPNNAASRSRVAPCYVVNARLGEIIYIFSR